VTADLALRVVGPGVDSVVGPVVGAPASGDAGRGPVLPAAAEFAVLLDPAFVGFAGHFPGAPVLPAMCHVDLAVRAASLAAGATLELVEIERARFTRRVGPGEEMTIRVRFGSETGGTRTVKADHRVGGEAAARMSLRLVVRA